MGRLLRSSHRIRIPRIRASKRLRTGVKRPLASAARLAPSCAHFGRELPAAIA